MIEINLLPEELRAKSKKLGIESRHILYLIPLAVGILIFVHLYLAAVGIIKSCQFNTLNNKWKKLQPQREMLKKLTNEYQVLSADAKVIEQLNMRRLIWSEKLNKLSLDLPGGIWFNEFTLSRKDFTLKGSVISLEKREMSLINKFIDNLKKDAVFSKDITGLELSSAQMRTSAGYDIFDFTLTAKINSAKNTPETQNKNSNGPKSR